MARYSDKKTAQWSAELLIGQKIFKTEKLSVLSKTNPELNNRPAEAKLVVVVSKPSVLAKKVFFISRCFLKLNGPNSLNFST